ncbi:MAG: HEAT repeat domain-containing protein [Planctomycetales bacterium]|nr:HEAT repeat domain-containing protein [Planctomycetales bacterium]
MADIFRYEKVLTMQTIHRQTRRLAWVAAACMLAVAARAAEPTTRSEDELIAVLKSDAPPAEKAITCKFLAVWGTEKAVPELAPLLADEHLASWARIALEAIPGESSAQALRDAAGKLEGRLLIGTINSIGQRRDATSVSALATILNKGNPEAAAAAAVSLGKIGTDDAAQVVYKALANPAAPVRNSAAEACVLCAEYAQAGGRADAAIALCDAVRNADVPKQRIVEATRRTILARGDEGIPLLVELLKSYDRAMWRVAMQVARELPGSKVTEALAAELVGLPPDRGALVVYALADRSDTTVSPAMLAAARSGPPEIRLAVVDLISRLGDASSVETLLQVAVGSDETLAAAARAGLASLPGADVDAEIAKRLETAEGSSLAALIHAVGERRIESATPVLLKQVGHADGAIRSAVLTALGETVALKNVSVLIDYVAKPAHPEDAETAAKALHAACVRMADREACAAQLASALPNSSADARGTFLETLGAMGGAKALATLHAAGKSDDALSQDIASRVLGEWMTVDAAPVLFDLTTAAPEEKYRTRALRGYIRLARQFQMPVAQRAEICQKSLAAAKRSDERKLVLEVLDRYPAIETLRVAVEATKVEGLKDDATRVAMSIAQKIGGKSAGAKELLAMIGQEPVTIEIIKAQYGAGDKQKDVTAVLRKHASGLRLIALPSDKYNDAFGGDPAQGVVKKLTVEYKLNGKVGTATFGENEAIMLPTPK